MYQGPPVNDKKNNKENIINRKTIYIPSFMFYK